MNSLFDPDFTGTGHQPYYFDQFATIYQRYTVIGSKLTATFTPIPAAINGPEQRSWMAQLCVQYGEILPLQTQLRCLQ